MSPLPPLLLWSLLLLAPVASAESRQAGAAVSEQAYPGTLQLSIDATDLGRRVYQVRERLPVRPGPLTLWYPQWIPGNHAPTGPINQIAGLVIQGGGQRLAWQRDPLDVYAFKLEVPEGVSELQIEFQYLSPTAADQGRVAMTTDLLSLQWHRLLLYPAGYDARRIQVEPQVRLPRDWRFATALQTAQSEDGLHRFRPVALVDLVDSPLYAGRYFRRFDLDPGARVPVHLNVIADAPEQLEATPQMLAAHRALVVQADKVFGARPFDHYDFLLAVSDHFSSIGLEHQQSSENGLFADYLRGEAPFYDNDLLPHEYAHVWNGKLLRPGPTWTPHFNTPMQNQLLWLYEGQTQFWAMVLAARSGLWTPEQARAVLAMTAANLDQRQGRRWRNLEDTVHQGIIDFNDAPQAWESWQRAYDFYAEGALLWLEVDAELRRISSGKRSLDDFARAFFANPGGKQETRTYGLDEVLQALQGVQAHDWAGFLQARLRSNGPGAPLAGLAGWQLVYNEQPNPAISDAEEEQGFDDFSYSLGLKIASEEGKINEVLWESPAHAAGLAKDMQVIAVDGMAYGAQRLKRALSAAKHDRTPIELLVRQGDAYRSVRIAYYDGLRYPHLQRVTGTDDQLSRVLAPL